VRITSIFLNRLEHGEDIFDGRLGLDVVDRAEDKPPSPAKNLDPFLNLASDFFRSPKGKGLLGIDAASPEGHAIPESSLQFYWIHLGRRALDRVQNVEAGFDEIFDECIDRAAGVDKGLP